MTADPPGGRADKEDIKSRAEHIFNVRSARGGGRADNAGRKSRVAHILNVRSARGGGRAVIGDAMAAIPCVRGRSPSTARLPGQLQYPDTTAGGRRPHAEKNSTAAETQCPRTSP